MTGKVCFLTSGKIPKGFERNLDFQPVKWLLGGVARRVCGLSGALWSRMSRPGDDRHFASAHILRDFITFHFSFLYISCAPATLSGLFAGMLRAPLPRLTHLAGFEAVDLARFLPKVPVSFLQASPWSLSDLFSILLVLASGVSSLTVENNLCITFWGIHWLGCYSHRHFSSSDDQRYIKKYIY